MWKRSGRRRMASEVEERVAIHAHLLPDGADAGRDVVGREGVVPGGDRRVGREDAAAPHLADGVGERRALRRQLADPLDHHERGVALVGVPHGGVDPDGPQHRTPPAPRIHSWRSRSSGPPAYSLFMSSRSSGWFASRLVSRRYTGTRPTIIRHARTCTGRPPVSTVARKGSRPGPGHPLERGPADVVLLVAVLLPSVERGAAGRSSPSCRRARRRSSARRDPTPTCNDRRRARRGRRSRWAPRRGARTRRRSRRGGRRCTRHTTD